VDFRRRSQARRASQSGSAAIQDRLTFFVTLGLSPK
jgi:hypothetical protein